MNKKLFTLLILLLPVTILLGQARVTRYSAAPAGSVVLKDVDDKYNAQVYSLQMPDPDEGADMEKLDDAKKQSHLRFPYQTTGNYANKITSAQEPTVLIGFIPDSLPGIPPDNHIAVSVQHKAVSVVNSNIAVLNGLTGQMQYRKSLYLFSLSVGLVNPIGGQNNYRYDPKILYDPVADRYICFMLNGINQYNWIVVGFSRSNKPDSSWVFYKFQGNYAGDTTWFDYPSIAMTQDEIFLTGNKIKYDSSWQVGFTQTLIYQIKKQDGYDSSLALNYQIWDSIGYNGNSIRCLNPVTGGAALYGPEQYFLSNRDFDVQNDTIFMVKIPDTIGSSNNTLTVTPLVSDLSYGMPPDGRQKNDTVMLATNDNRILGAYRENNEIDFVSASVVPANGASGIYLGRISNFGSSPTVHGELLTVDTLDFGYPNISYTGNTGGLNNSIISFDYSGPHDFPGLGAVYYDGTQFSSLLKVKTGDTTINILQDGSGHVSSEQRWGDYTGSQPNWVAIGSVWVDGIYGRHQSNSYGNYMAELASPSFAGIPKTTITQPPSVLYPNPAWKYVQFEFIVQEQEPVSFVIYDIQGRAVDKLLEHNCSAGKNIIQFNIAPFTTGTYYLKAIDNKGRIISVNSFVRQ